MQSEEPRAVAGRITIATTMVSPTSPAIVCLTTAAAMGTSPVCHKPHPSREPKAVARTETTIEG